MSNYIYHRQVYVFRINTRNVLIKNESHVERFNNKRQNWTVTFWVSLLLYPDSSLYTYDTCILFRNTWPVKSVICMQFITRIVTTYISGKLSECCSFFAPTAGGWLAVWLQCSGVRGLGTKLAEGWVCPRSGLVAAASTLPPPGPITRLPKPYIQICVA